MAFIELTSAGMKKPVVINTDQIVSYYTQQAPLGRPDVTKINMAAAAEGSATYVLVTESFEQLVQLLGQVGETVHRLAS